MNKLNTNKLLGFNTYTNFLKEIKFEIVVDLLQSSSSPDDWKILSNLYTAFHRQAVSRQLTAAKVLANINQKYNTNKTKRHTT